MKEYINLLPEKNKEEIREEKKFRDVLGKEFGFIFPVGLLILVIFAIKAILGIQGGWVESPYFKEQSQNSYQDLKKYEEKFKVTNSNANLISKVQEEHLSWADVLVKLSQVVPNEISITGIANKDFRLFLMGRAKTRERLLELQTALNSSECFNGINMPLSNLVSKEDIDFQIDFEVKRDCLKN